MNKKRLIFLGLFAIIVVIVWLLFSFWDYYKNKNDNKSSYKQPDFTKMTARETADWDTPFLKEVKVEFMEDTDFKKMGIASSSNIRLQVLERDENGNIISYKKVFKDEDIVRYKVDYSGIPDIISTSSATSTEIK